MKRKVNLEYRVFYKIISNRLHLFPITVKTFLEFSRVIKKCC